jgi:hypothetical protein
MTAIPDHYAALGIDPTADPEGIAAAYRALAKKYHPDTGATTGTASTERFEQVQRAYEVLRTPESRRKYDLELLAQTERDLAEHLARKRRALPGAAGAPAGLPNPDLGAIRPEPLAAQRGGRRPAAHAEPAARRSSAPYLIPAVLVLALLGAAAWLVLPGEPRTPAIAVAENAAPAAETPPAPPATEQPAASASPSTEAVTAAMPEELQQPATKADAEAVPSASPTPVPASAEPEEAAEAPVFGASEPEDAGAGGAPAPVPAAPTPTPRPAKQTAAIAKPPANKPPVTRGQPVEGGSAYTLTIFERRRHGRIITRQADMLFASRGSCVEFGVKAVLRRMEARNMNPRRQRVWYECEPAL